MRYLKCRLNCRIWLPGSPQERYYFAINKKAEAAAKRYPASNTVSYNKIEEVKALDLDGEQFKTIQNDLRKIVPQYQD